MNETTAFTLACRDRHAAPPVLAGVDAAARLDGVLLALTLRQTYRNAGTQLLEVVYTFPLPPQATLLGLATTLNGERMEGQVLPRRAAERTYEEGLADGDAPVLLEAHADGLHSANIGNLKPGDEIVVEVRIAQVVALEQGRLRLAIPSTIAPRYGDAGQAGLQPQQAPQASLAADYPLALTWLVAGSLADAAVDCPTHLVVSRRTDAGLEIALAPGARLDRDVVLVVTPPSVGAAVVTQARDERAADAPTVLLAALPVPMPALRERIALKLLVDCSGSMGGDSIASARRALDGIAARLAPADAVSLTRFGSSVQHASALRACSPTVLAQLARDIAATDADLGGTEMQSALESVFALAETPAGRPRATPADAAADVLMITDGEVWNVDPLIAAARQAGQRVFVIGVGASPAEGVLRRLAQATGGACEFAAPGEALEAAAARMLARIRQRAWRELRLDWGGEAAWQGELPLCAFGGDTLAVFAGLRGEAGAAAPVRLLARGGDGTEVALATADGRSVAEGDTLPRIAAANRLATLETDAATSLAVAYQLMSPHTSCVMVHRRAQADRSTEEAQLQRVEGMLAAGWGGTGSVMEMSRSAAAMPAPLMAAPMMKRRAKMAAPDVFSEVFADAAPPRPAPARATKPLAAIASPVLELAQAIRERLWRRTELDALLERCRELGLRDAVDAAIAEVVAQGLTDAQAWALLVQWADGRGGTDVFGTLPEAIRLRVRRLDAGLVAATLAAFDRHLAATPLATA